MAWQQLFGGVFYPTPPDVYYTTGPSHTGQILNTSSDRLGMVFRIGKAGNIRKFGIVTRAVTTGTTLDLRIETVNLTDGNPSGTLWATDTNASLVVGSGDDYVFLESTLTADAVVSLGDLIAAVVANSGSGVLNLAASSDWQNCYASYCSRYTASAWTKQTGVVPICLLQYDDGSYVYSEGIHASVSVTHTSYGSTSSPDERGLKFSFPMPVKIRGIWAYIDPDNNFNIKLYDTDGSTTLIDLAIDNDAVVSKAERLFVYLFPSIVTLQKNSFYRLTLVPNSATTMELGGITVNAAAHLDCEQGGQNFHQTTRTDSGSWTDTTTARPYIGLILDSFDDGSGQIVIPRRGGSFMKM